MHTFQTLDQTQDDLDAFASAIPQSLVHVINGTDI
jgi:hypothetical protein